MQEYQSTLKILGKVVGFQNENDSCVVASWYRTTNVTERGLYWWYLSTGFNLFSWLIEEEEVLWRPGLEINLVGEHGWHRILHDWDLGNGC